MFGVDDRNKWDRPHDWRAVPFDAPDYSKPEAWGLHPRHARLEVWPKGYGPVPEVSVWKIWQRSASALDLSQAIGPADVFFVHPTTHVALDDEWNADWNSEVANAIADKWPLQHQASVFRGCGRIFAPRYRQAHLRCFYQPGPDSEKALDLAYLDVHAAFRWFLERENQGRPIVLAGHSQGSYHCIRLLMDFFDLDDAIALRERLVAAYLPGMQLMPSALRNVQPMYHAEATGGYLTWMTASEGHYPDFYQEGFDRNPTVNPITWEANLGQYSSYEEHLGILNRSFRVRHEAAISAKPHDGLLWIKPLKVALGSLVKMQDWHVADYNLFWPNIRRNAERRVRIWSEKQGEPS